MAAVFALAKGIDVAALNTQARTFTVSSYRPIRQVCGKVMGIVGVGGIGRSAARLARANGMRVIGTRRSIGGQPASDADIDQLYSPERLHEMLTQADFAVIAAMLTEETEGLIGEKELSSLPEGAFLINVARGEIVQDKPLAEALLSGRLAGAYLDVWTNDMWSPPSDVLLSAPNIIFTPHISGRSDVPGSSSLQFFCANLARFIRGAALENCVDWQRGY